MTNNSSNLHSVIRSVFAPFVLLLFFFGCCRAWASSDHVTVDTPVPASISGGDTIVAPSAQLIKAATGFSFTEGCSCDSHGNVYFTDQPNDCIYRWDARTGAVSLFLHPCGRSNGTSFDSAGNLWTCADNKNELWEIAVASRVVTDVVTNFRGQLLNGPNDVWINPKSGGMYLTDPYYVRPYWQRGPMEQPGQNVLYLAPDHKTLSLAITDMQQPNGIIGTPDGKTLYVSDIRGGKTFAYTIEKDGTLTHERLFCKLGSDGMTIDSAGNVYCTGHGVTVFDKTGAQIAHIPIDEGWTGNICFGGSDRKTLFITATTSIYLLRMQVHGVGSQ